MEVGEKAEGVWEDEETEVETPEAAILEGMNGHTQQGYRGRGSVWALIR